MQYAVTCRLIYRSINRSIDRDSKVSESKLIEPFLSKGSTARPRVDLEEKEKESNEETDGTKNLELTTSYSVRNNLVHKTTSGQFRHYKFQRFPWSLECLSSCGTFNEAGQIHIISELTSQLGTQRRAQRGMAVPIQTLPSFLDNVLSSCWQSSHSSRASSLQAHALL